MDGRRIRPQRSIVRRQARVGARVAGSSMFREPRVVRCPSSVVRRWWLCVRVWRKLAMEGWQWKRQGVVPKSQQWQALRLKWSGQWATGDGQRWILVVDQCTHCAPTSKMPENCSPGWPGPENSQMSCREDGQRVPERAPDNSGTAVSIGFGLDWGSSEKARAAHLAASRPPAVIGRGAAGVAPAHLQLRPSGGLCRAAMRQEMHKMPPTSQQSRCFSPKSGRRRSINGGFLATYFSSLLSSAPSTTILNAMRRSFTAQLVHSAARVLRGGAAGGTTEKPPLRIARPCARPVDQLPPAVQEPPSEHVFSPGSEKTLGSLVSAASAIYGPQMANLSQSGFCR